MSSITRAGEAPKQQIINVAQGSKDGTGGVQAVPEEELRRKHPKPPPMVSLANPPGVGKRIDVTA
ncbi:MAG: hypothetical protein HY462_01090 [Parcubacteria group bacterium]|nr:hypothetical protein [Parcubacteria group bacterium]